MKSVTYQSYFFVGLIPQLSQRLKYTDWDTGGCSSFWRDNSSEKKILWGLHSKIFYNKFSFPLSPYLPLLGRDFFVAAALNCLEIVLITSLLVPQKRLKSAPVCSEAFRAPLESLRSDKVQSAGPSRLHSSTDPLIVPIMPRDWTCKPKSNYQSWPCGDL